MRKSIIIALAIGASSLIGGAAGAATATQTVADPLFGSAVPMDLKAPELRATVHDVEGAPAVGTVGFNVDGMRVCDATLDGDGVAVCAEPEALQAAMVAGGYEARFAAQGGYSPSTDHAGVVACYVAAEDVCGGT